MTDIRLDRLRALGSSGNRAAMAQRASAPATVSDGVSFGPRRLVRQGHMQTLLARRRPADSITLRTEQPMLIDAGLDETGYDPQQRARLLGYLSPSLSPSHARGLVMLVHGWHGHSHSADILYMAETLLRAGYGVFRINLRDHGPNREVDRMALNRGMFMATLLNEVAVATRHVAALAGDTPFALVGGSLGGNFVLRLAAAHNQTPIPSLQRVIAVCPAVRPAAAAESIDRYTAYRIYFRARWMQGLRAKQRLFPELYNFTQIERMRSIVDMTELLVHDYSPWRDAQDYYDHYAVSPEMVASIRAPTTIIAARDDAVIPVADIEALPSSDRVKIYITETGGHMGFVDVFPYRRWLPGAILHELQRERA